MTTPKDPFAIVRTKQYVALLILAAVLGVVISFLVYWYLKLVTDMQTWVFTDLPKGLGFSGEPPWWPLLPLAVAGAIVGATIRYLPGRGGHSPADGFQTGPPAAAINLPGIFIASLAGLSLGAVIGPEAPVIALGGGLAVLAVKLARRDVPQRTAAVLAATGSFAAISTLLGNPLSGAVLLLEASGLGGATATIALLPGLVGAGIGSLIFLGLGSLTGYGTFSLAVPDLPPAAHLNVAQLGWAIAIGAAAAVVCVGIKRSALFVRPHIERLLLVLTPLAGFRGGPIFPSLFVGATGGILLSHLPGLPVIAGAAIGIGAMVAGMLQLPITAVLITTLFLGTDGVNTMPLTILAVVTSFVLTKWLTGPPSKPAGGEQPAEDTGAPAAPPKQRAATDSPSPSRRDASSG